MLLVSLTVATGCALALAARAAVATPATNVASVSNSRFGTHIALANPTLHANVGPSYSISLSDAAGNPVTRLEAGTYTIVVNDQSDNHNFHLIGPGVDLSTTVGFIGQVSWTVTLAPGSYRFLCDPHAEIMFGSFTVADTTPPETAITAGPAGTVSSTSASFSFSSSEAGSSFQCSLDGAAFAACNSPTSYIGLTDGSHTFQVRALDAAGNTDPTPADRTWTVDTVPPETTITAGPSGTVASSSASFEFAASEAGASFECSLDGAAFTPCSSPTTYVGLADGAHAFEVRALDAAANIDPSPARRAWTVDTTPPETTLDAGPSGTVGSTSASFAFSSTEAGATFECSLDDAPFAPCSSPQSYSALANGTHNFQVRATDSPGNTDSTPAARTWTINTTALYATAGPGYTISLTNAAGAPITRLERGIYTIVVHDESAGHNFHLTGPGVDASTTVPFVGEVIWTVTFASGAYRFLCDPHFEIMFGDFAVSDTTPPETTIDSGPSGAVGSSSASFGFSASEAGATFECSLDGVPFAACSSPTNYTGVANGSHTFRVRAIDAAGNVDPTPASRTWRVDTVPPETTITAGPSGTSASSSASFEFVSSEAGSSFECSLDAAPFSPCSSPQNYLGLVDGDHTFAVRAIDPVGNVDPTPARRTWTVEAAPPETTITEGPSGIVASSSASFEFVSSDAGSSFECSLDGAPFVPCSAPQSYSALADGGHTFQVRAIDAAAHVDPTPASRSWMVEAAPPDTIITAGPSGVVASSSASFSFSANEAGSTFQCALDGAPFVACSSPQSYSALAEGAHTFDVRAIDAAGKLDPSPASRAWTVDTIPPGTTITSGPAGTVAATSATFEFAASEAGSTFQCALDGALFVACSSPQSYSALAEGVHAFDVRAIDAAGNVDLTPDRRSWTVDTVAPETAITAAPRDADNRTSASFSFSASEAGSSFECALDGGAFAACTSPKSYSELANGSHTFQVRAIDAVGNVDPTPAARSWTVDTVAPDTTITAGPSGTANSASASFGFSSSEPGSTFQCSLDGAAYSACTSPHGYAGLANGSHTFRVRAIDAAGTVDPSAASRTWSVDTVAPDTTITAAPSGTVASSSATFEFVASEAGARFECSLDGLPFASCDSPQGYLDLADGDHTFAVRALDAAGNADASPARRSWTVAAAPPDTIITAGPSGTVASSSATFEFVASEAGASFDCSLDGAPFAPCSSPQSYGALADGVHTFAVRATEPPGNVDPSPASRTWTIDTTPPETTLDAGPSGTVASSSARFEFSSGDPGPSFECSLDGAPFAPCSSPHSYSALPDGVHTFAVRALDAAGNADPTPVSRTWTVEAAPPDTTITAGPSGTVASSSASFSFSANEAGSTFQCSLDAAPFAPCGSPQSYSALADGAHTFQVRAIDAAGNVDPSPASRTWTVDTTPPETTITAGPPDPDTNPAPSFEFSASEAGATFECALDGAAFAPCSSPQSYSGLASGTHTFAVRATDAAGNVDATPASRTWTVQAP